MSGGETDIQQCVDRLCEAGCERVYEYMEALRADRPIPEIGPLTPDERAAVLGELQSIMAVYERKGR